MSATKVRLTLALCTRRLPNDDVRQWIEERPKWAAEWNRLQDDPRLNVDLIVRVGGEVARQRNEVVAIWEEDETRAWLLWIDDDIEWTADQVWALLLRRASAIGGIYCKREPGGCWVFNPYHGIYIREDGLLRIANTGQGFLLMHRSVFDQLRERIPDDVPEIELDGMKMRPWHENRHLWDERLKEFKWVSEDYHLSYLLRKAKIPLWADTRVQVAHVDADGTSYPLGGEAPSLPYPRRAWQESDRNRIAPSRPLVVVLRRDTDIGEEIAYLDLVFGEERGLDPRLPRVLFEPLFLLPGGFFLEGIGIEPDAFALGLAEGGLGP